MKFLSVLMASVMLVAPAFAQDDLTEVTILFPGTGTVTNFPLDVAIHEGYFAEEGLSVKAEAVDGSAAVLQAIISGQADMGAAGIGPVLNARARGEDVIYFYNHNVRSTMGIAVKADSGVEDVEGLRGKTIGVGTPDGSEVAFARSALQESGLTENVDYTFLPVGPGGLAAAAFLRGDIDAYVGTRVDAATLTSKGVVLKDITPEKYLSFFGNGYVTTERFIEEHPEVIEAFGRAYVRASEWGIQPENKDAVLSYSAIRNPLEGEDKEYAGNLYEETKSRIIPTDRSTWGMHHEAEWDAWQESLIASGSLNDPSIDVHQAYTNQFIEAWNTPK